MQHLSDILSPSYGYARPSTSEFADLGLPIKVCRPRFADLGFSNLRFPSIHFLLTVSHSNSLIRISNTTQELWIVEYDRYQYKTQSIVVLEALHHEYWACSKWDHTREVLDDGVLGQHKDPVSRRVNRRPVSYRRQTNLFSICCRQFTIISS